MVRASSVLAVTRDSESCRTAEKEKPREADAGPFQQRDFGGVSNSADRITASVLAVIQARNHVATLMDFDARLDNFTAAAARDELRVRYLACWEIYAAVFPTPVREAFAELMGVPFTRFESALSAVGWALATPAARERHRRNPDAVVTPEDIGDE